MYSSHEESPPDVPLVVPPIKIEESWVPAESELYLGALQSLLDVHDAPSYSSELDIATVVYPLTTIYTLC